MKFHVITLWIASKNQSLASISMVLSFISIGTCRMMTRKARQPSTKYCPAVSKGVRLLFVPKPPKPINAHNALNAEKNLKICN
jgi:hypothetical protein